MTTTTTTPAEHRIRNVARVVGVLSFVIAIATISSVVMTGVERELNEQSRNPWREAVPLEAQREPGSSVWTAERSARITLPAELRGRPIELQMVDETEVVVYAYLDNGVADDRPSLLGSVSDHAAMPIAAYENSDIWITSRHPWRIAIRPVDPLELESSANGNSHAVFVYRGDATSGRVSWGSRGTLFVTARTIAGYESLVAESGADRRGPGGDSVTWTASPFVVIEVKSFDATWSIDLDVGPTQTPTDEATEEAP